MIIGMTQKLWSAKAIASSVGIAVYVINSYVPQPQRERESEGQEGGIGRDGGRRKKKEERGGDKR